MFHMRFNSWPWSIFTQSKGHLMYYKICSKLFMIFRISFPQQMFLLWLQKKTSPE